MDSQSSSSKPWVPKWTYGERLDGGGQGDTFLVPSRANPCGVMKLLKDTHATDPKSRRRMFQEVSNLKILHSAGARVPQVLDDNTNEFENVNVPLFFVMQYIKGQTLARVIAEKQQLSFDTSIALTLDLCKTFGFAFRERISHRDIKPENLIVTPSEKPEIVVVDFGLSFNEDHAEKLTDLNEAFDNKFISLPERRGPGENKRDPRSDITGICAVFFYCLTGCAPRNLRDSKNRPPHRWENFSMTKVGPTPIHAGLLNALFDRGFNYELQNRFQTLEEFEQRVWELQKAKPLPPTEDLTTIAQRESRVLKETDRTTFLGDLRRQAYQTFSGMLDQRTQSINRKLTGTLFYLQAPQLTAPYQNEDGDEVFRYVQDLTVQNHALRVGIQLLIICNGNECSVLRRMYDMNYQTIHQGTNFQNLLAEIITRYDARLENADANLLAAEFEKTVALAVPRLRDLIAAQTEHKK